MEADEETLEPPQDGVTKLDITTYQQYLNSVTLPPSLTELDLAAGHLSRLNERVRLLTQLKKLSLRQNLFDDSGVEPLCHWNNLSSLEELIFRDNNLANIPDVSIFKNLFVFDASVNEISSPSGLSKLCNKLRELYVSKNKITKIEEIEHLHELQVLELGSNVLQVMENLETLVNLQELWLGDNQIETVNLCGLKCIKKLSLQSNRLTSMKGFQECVALEELYLSHNSISEMEGLTRLINLRVLDVPSNKLRVMENLETLVNLQELWLGDNQIETVNLCGLKCIKKLSLQSNRLTSMKGFQECVALEELYLSHNSISKTEGLTGLINLRVLDVSSNKLISTDGTEKLRLEKLTIQPNPCAILGEETIKKVISQVQIYFSLDYLPKMWNYLCFDRFVSLDRVCKLREMKAILKLNKKTEINIPKDILMAVGEALRTSPLISLSEDGTKVSGITEFTELEKVMRRIYRRTVAVSPFSKNVDVSIIKDLFSPYGVVEDVRIVESDSFGTAMVKFERRRVAKSVLELSKPLSYEGVDLVVKSKDEYDANYLKEKENKKRKAEEARVSQDDTEDYWEEIPPRKCSKLSEHPLLLENRMYKKLERMNDVPFPEAIFSRFQTKFQNPIPVSGRITINKESPNFLISWVVPENHYIINKEKIKPEKHIHKSRFSDLMVHFMDFCGVAIKESERSKWDSTKTAYIADLLGEVYSSLNQPNHKSKTIKKSYNTHVSKQNILNQQEAVEMLIACHHQYKMRTLLKDMRGRAKEFAERDNIFIDTTPADHKTYPRRYRLKARDLLALIRDLLGPNFFPEICMKGPKGEKVLHEIRIRVNMLGQPVHLPGKNMINCAPDEDVIF